MNIQSVFSLNPHFSATACQIVLDIDSTQMPGYLELARRYPLADGLRDLATCHNHCAADVEALCRAARNGELGWAGIGWLVFSPSFVCAAQERGMTAEAYADWLYRQCDEVNRELGRRVAWIEAYGEIGNSLTWPAGKTFIKAEALRYFREWFTTGRVNSEHWHGLTPPEVQSFHSHARKQNPDFRSLPIYYTDGTLFVLHEAFRQGFPLVAYEGHCGTLNALQAGIAFTRGGAKAFDAFWGVDLSPWTYGPLGTVAGVNDTGSSVEGITPDAMARAWLTMYLSGANLLLHEAAPLFFYTRTGGATTQLSDYGYRAMQLHRLVHGALADRGTPVAPLAILIEEEHGYRGDMVREYHADGRLTFHHEGNTPEQRLLLWNGRVTGLTAGDWQLHRLLTSLWPWPDNAWGELVGNWPNEARQDPSPDSDPELTAKIRVGALDARDYDRCGHDSAWADCVDVIPEDTPGDRMSAYYKTVMLAGDVRTDNGLWARLDAYAGQGGTVVATLEQLTAEARNALGLNVSGTPTPAALTGARLTDGMPLEFQENVFLHAVTAPAATTAWATAVAGARPLVLDVPRGQGRIYVVLIATGLTAETRRLPAVVTALLDRLVARDLGISKRGPGCQMLVNRRADDTLVTLINHAGRDWHGEVRFTRAGYPAVADVRDLLADHSWPAGLADLGPDTVTVRVRIPAYESKILSFGQRQPARPAHGVQEPAPARAVAARQRHADLLRQGPQTALGINLECNPL